jgi:hypothetical protein
MRSSLVGMRSSRVWMRSNLVVLWTRSSLVWMRSSQLVRASNSQCKKRRNSPACSIPASSDTVESEGRQMKQRWIRCIKLNKKNPPVFLSSDLYQNKRNLMLIFAKFKAKLIFNDISQKLFTFHTVPIDVNYIFPSRHATVITVLLEALSNLNEYEI